MNGLGINALRLGGRKAGGSPAGPVVPGVPTLSLNPASSSVMAVEVVADGTEDSVTFEWRIGGAWPGTDLNLAGGTPPTYTGEINGQNPNTLIVGRAKANGPEGSSAWCADVSAATNGVPPATPTLVLSNVGSTTMNFTLTCDDTELEVSVEYSVGGASWPGTTVSMTDQGGGVWTGQATGFSPEDTVWGRGKGSNGWGESSYHEASDSTDGVPPTAPSNLVATWNADPITPVNALTWIDGTGSGTIGFKVYRKKNAEAYAEYSSGSPSSGTFNDNDGGMMVPDVYTYYVTNTNSWGESSPSNEDDATLF